MTDDARPGCFDIGGAYVFELANGRRVSGIVTGRAGDWLHLERSGGPLFVNAAQVVCYQIKGSGSCSGDDDARPARARRCVDPSAWDEADLRRLAEGYLDGHSDAELATICQRPRVEVRRLRRSFEAARGSLDLDRLGDEDRDWVGRWQAVLSG